MPVEYVEVDDAIAAPGLRMVVVGGVPSPWGEGAKGVLHVKGLPWRAVRLTYDEPRLASWAGALSGPIAIYDDEPPVDGWRDILDLAERLAPEPALLPADANTREMVLALCRDLLSEGGLAWSRRLQLVHAGLSDREGGFARPVAAYIGGKYGYSAEAGAACGARVRGLLQAFAQRLHDQKDRASAYYVGEGLTAADIYSAVVLALFAPLPEAVCPMSARARAAFESLDDETRAALDPILLAHRDMMYARHLETPLSL